MPQKKRAKAKKAAVSVLAERIKSVAVIAFVLSVICANIFLRVRITEINSEISAVKSEITELESEQTRLSVELENKISYKNIESAAVQLGMKKMDKSQVIYIKTNSANAARTSDGLLSAAKD